MTVAHLSSRARADLRDVLEFRGLHSDRAALRFADGFDQAMERLIQFPEFGRRREDLGEDIRMLVLSEFRLNVYYHVLKGEDVTQVLVVRLLRQERDVTADDIEAGL